EGGEHLRVAIIIQLAVGVVFIGAALIARHALEHGIFNGSATLYWVLVVSVISYSASYFARGYLAGSRMFALYGGLVFMESVGRCFFAFVVAIGIAKGQAIVAFGVAAAPLLSLSVVPWALGRRIRADDDPYEAAIDPVQEAGVLDAAAETGGTEPEFTLAHGAGFAVAVLVIMLSEQAIYNVGPLLIKATE